MYKRASKPHTQMNQVSEQKSGNHTSTSPVFATNREAFQYWCSLPSASVELKAQMFDNLAYDGYQAHSLLPHGWIYLCSESDVSFLNINGAFLSNVNEASDYFKSLLSHEDYLKYESFLSDVNVTPPTSAFDTNLQVSNETQVDMN